MDCSIWMTDQVVLLCALDHDDGSLALDAKRIRGPLLFARLRRKLGIDAVLDGLLAMHQFILAVERARVRGDLAQPVRLGLRPGLRVVDGRL